MGKINIFAVALCAIVGVILALVLKSTGSGMGTCISLFLCIAVSIYMFSGLTDVYSGMNVFAATVSQEYIRLIIKIIGISYVTEISSAVCRENGFSALASAMEIYARISIVALCLPVIVTLLEMVEECL